MTKTALITGASSGIGRAAAQRLARDGSRTILVARRADPLNRLAAEIGDTAHARPCDVGDPAAIDALVAKITTEFGTPDLVINAAGAGRWLRLEDTSADEAQAMLAAPFLGAFHLCRAVLPGMLARGTGILIHVQSPAAFVPWPHSVGYAVSRFGLRGLHEALAQDLAGSGVHSCQIVFGEVHSGYFDANPGARDLIPRLGRMMKTLTPEDCAETISRVAARPRPVTCRPWLLGTMLWASRVAPGLMRWLVRRSAPKAARRN